MNRQERIAFEQRAVLRSLSEHPALLLEGPNTLGLLRARQALIAKYNLSEDEKGLVDSDRHPDFFHLDGRSATTDEAKEARDRTSAVPARWAHRYLVLSYADRLHYAAAQSLLKIIEEPHPSLRTIITTDRPQSLPPTILSRSTVVVLDPPPMEEIEAYLKGKGVEDASWRAIVCGGHIDAAEELDPVVTKEWHKLWSTALAGLAPPADTPYSWSERASGLNSATLAALWHILVEIAARKLDSRFWREIALRAMKERERAHRGKAEKLLTATLITRAYVLAKTSAKRKK
jgi:hypothetical protein